MQVFLAPHQVYCYAGIHSIAAAIQLRHNLNAPVQVHLSSQPKIIADLRKLHGDWSQSRQKGLETVTVLGPLAQQNVEQDSEQPNIVALLNEMVHKGVRVTILNEYNDFPCFEGTSVNYSVAPKPTLKAPKNPMLVGKVAELFGENKDVHELRKALKSHELDPKELEKRDPLIFALEWVLVEIFQYRNEIGPLERIVEDLGNPKCTELPEGWIRRAAIQKERGLGVLVGSAYEHILDRARVVASSNLPVIVLGETGSGKEMMARRIHDASARWDKPFVAESCANFTENLFESVLFGTVKGAYTGALSRNGLLEEANGGTLFLDEIGELSLINQGKLLRVLQEKRFRRLGETKLVRIDVRLIAATNVDLYALARQGKFRLDLWYRLAGDVIQLPTLTSIKQDLHKIATHLLIQISNEDPEILAKRRHADNQLPLRLDPQDTKCLAKHTWPGNVRELRLVVHQHLATNQPLSDIVNKLIAREENFLSKENLPTEADQRPSDIDHAARQNLQPASELGSSVGFAVTNLLPVKTLTKQYLAWAEAQNPHLNRHDLALKLGVSTETLRKHLGATRQR